METVRLSMAQALVRYLCAQHTEIDGHEVPLFAGVWAIFGHGNVAALGEALQPVQERLPTWRSHCEQAMAHSAVAYAKQMRRRRMMAVTSSIGPGATNMVTAAAVAHVNRLPVLLLPGDTFQHRRPDPVLQQVEDFADPAITANDCFKTGFALLGSHRAPGAADHVFAAGDIGANQRCRLWPSDALFAAGRAS